MKPLPLWLPGNEGQGVHLGRYRAWHTPYISSPDNSGIAWRVDRMAEGAVSVRRRDSRNGGGSAVITPHSTANDAHTPYGALHLR